MMLLTVKFICYLMRCLKKQATTVFRHLDVSVWKKFPFNLHQIKTILITFLMVDLSCCCPAVCKVFGIYTEVLKDVSNPKLLLYSKLLINGRLVPFWQNYSLTRTPRAQVPMNSPFKFPLTDLSYSRMEQICFTLSMDIKHGLNT